jgi:hypothetical protein
VVISGLNQETKRALDLSCFQITGKKGELRTPVRGWQSCFTGFIDTAQMGLFFLYVTLLNPTEPKSKVVPMFN